MPAWMQLFKQRLVLFISYTVFCWFVFSPTPSSIPLSSDNHWQRVERVDASLEEAALSGLNVPTNLMFFLSPICSRVKAMLSGQSFDMTLAESYFTFALCAWTKGSVCFFFPWAHMRRWYILRNRIKRWADAIPHITCSLSLCTVLKIILVLSAMYFDIHFWS